MELTEAVEIVVARYNFHRARALTDPTHPAYNPAYRVLVLQLAEGRGPEPVLVPPAVAAVAAAPTATTRPRGGEWDALEILRACDCARLAPCNCQGSVFCGEGGTREGEKVPIATCRECLADRGRARPDAMGAAFAPPSGARTTTVHRPDCGR